MPGQVSMKKVGFWHVTPTAWIDRLLVKSFGREMDLARQ